MEAKPHQENIFTFSRERPFSPQFYDSQHVYEQLGYSRLDSEEPKYQELHGEFEEFYKRNVALGVKTAAGTIFRENPGRVQLQPPEVTILERNGNYFYEFSYADNMLRIIVDATLTDSRYLPSTKVQGYPIEHVLVQGEDNRILDLASLRRGEPLMNLFQFSGASAMMVPEQVATIGEKSLRLSSDYVFMGLSTQDNGGFLSWRPEVFPYAYLHENGHAALWEYDQTRYRQPDAEATNLMRITIERDADAIAMTTARSVIKTYGFSSPVFNLQEQEGWTQEHLANGYDIIAAGRDKPYTHYATRESRAKARKQDH